MNVKDRYFSISEVANRTNVNAYTIRYWEKKDLIRPIHIKNGIRKFTEDDINLILKLKDLILNKNLNIKGVKSFIKIDNNYKKISFLKDYILEIEKDIKDILEIFNNKI